MPTRIPVPAAATRLWNRIPPALRLPLTVFASCWIVLLIWWAAFFPGLMSYDSVAYVWQVSTGNWMGNHSILYDSFVWLSLQITGDLWLLTLGQTIVMAATLAYTSVALRDLGARGRWCALAALAVVSLPSTGTLSIFIWKDAAFGIAALLAFAASARLLARRIKGRGQVRDRAFYWDMAVLGVGFLGISLFRNNSVLVILFAFPFFVIALTGMRRWITALTAGATAVFLLLQFVVYPAVGIVMPTKDQVYAFNYADIADAYGRHPWTFTASDLATMEKVAPLSFWRGPASNCYSVDATLAKPFDHKAAAANNDALMTVWYNVLKRTPQDITYAHICRADIAWSIWPGPTSLKAGTLITTTPIPKNLYGWANWNQQVKHSPYRPIMKSRPLSTTLHKAGTFVYNISMTPQLQWLLWRGALWCYLLYGIAIAYAVRLRRRPAYALVGITVGLQLTVLAANPAQLARYMLPPFYIGIMSLALLPTLRAARSQPAAVPAAPPLAADPEVAEAGEPGGATAAPVETAGSARH
ncbi:hypothetical protein ACEZDB_21240 [Streptacidiphilus sp. N1-3]|uniref:Dolichyl-phosphate-mannose-protein mannosyltransferase n=1 Tax=Streptacidiphilus alkalitolerans TaxID=3342712 RepID=A0ABV6X4N6_9ACTN